VVADDLALELTDLRKSYGAVQALRGVNLSVARGEVFGFLGPNGSGKTTTIRCLLDLIRPSGGQVRVLGLDPQADPTGVRARCGYLPGELHLEGNNTVSGALRFLNRLRGDKAEWAYVTSLARRLDLPMDMKVRNLSKGNRQKVGVVQALMHRPELLLLDEPTSGLDPLIQQVVLKLIAEARANGATVFFSSHVLSEVQSAAERVAIIRLGVVVEVAATSGLLQRSFRRVRLRFREPVDMAPVLAVPGVSMIGRDNGAGLLLQVAGEMDGLIRALALLPVSEMETERPTLEEIFLAYYAAPEAK
jgi:ABC-2 type transport system ATP-binding protein